MFSNTLAAASALTAKSSPDERSQCVIALKWLQKNWPLAELAESAISGLDSDAVKDAVAKETNRIEKSMEESMQASLTIVRKQIKVCTKLLVGLDVTAEAEFRKQIGGSHRKLLRHYRSWRRSLTQ